ncbi:MAG: dTDP-4-dehydrorhamnose reductase [Thermodesulfobacteriota bacterium]
MNLDRVLIIGAGGMLGRDCVEVLGEAWTVIPLTRAELDLRDGRGVMDRVLGLRPSVIVNCAGYTQVDRCEQHSEEARMVNALGPGNLARAASATRAFLVHISTDYVFDGTKPLSEAYDEDDAPAPLNVYGRTKWEGERVVRSYSREHLIVRTAWLYGASGRSFPKAILAQALQGKALRVVKDQFGSPTWTRTLARQILLLIEHRVKGTVHATSQGHCSWYEFARAFLEQIGVRAEITPCSTQDYPRPAVRPSNSVLANRRLKELGLDMMPHWKEDLRRFVERHGPDLRREALAA